MKVEELLSFRRARGDCMKNGFCVSKVGKK